MPTRAIELIYLLMSAGGLVVAYVLTVALVRRVPGVYASGLVATIALPNLAASQLLMAAGFSIQVIDVLIVVGFGAAAFGLKHLRGNLQGHGAPLLLLAAATYSMVVGISRYGTAAVAQGRATFVMMAATAFFLSLEQTDWRDRILTWMVRAGVVMVLVGCWNWYARGLGSNTTWILDPSTGELINGRILNGAQAVTLAMAFTVLVVRWAKQPRPRAFLVWFAFASILVLSQQRTAALAAVAAFLLLSAKGNRGAFLRVAMVGGYAAAFVAVVALITGVAQPVADQLQTTIESASGEGSTVTDRTTGWQILIEKNIDAGPSAVALGEPFGTPYTRFVGGKFEDYSPHNWLISLFVRVGLLGAAAAVVLLIQMAKNAWLDRDRRDLKLALWGIAVVFSVSYSLDVAFAPSFALLLATPLPGAGAPQPISDKLPGSEQARGEGRVIRSSRTGEALTR